MNRLGHPEHGYTTCNSGEEEALLKAGWHVVTEKEWREIIAAKLAKNAPKPIDSVSESAMMEVQPARRVGRPRNKEDSEVI